MEDKEQSLALARIEVKIDTLLLANTDHETRLRTIEQSGFVTARQLWTAVVGSATVLSAAAAALALILK